MNRGVKDGVTSSNWASSRWASRTGILGLAALYGYLVVFLYHHESKDNGGHLGDFRTFYQAAQFALQGRDIYTAGHNSSQMYVYPPLIAYLYTPLTILNELQAAHVSLVLNALILLGCVLLASRAMLERLGAYRPKAVITVAFVVSLLSINELRAQLVMLETDALMLLMFTLALWWLDRHPIATGMALALALNIKYLTIVAVPYLVLRRRGRALAGMAAGSVFFALLPAAVLGWRENLRCLRVALGGLLRWVGVPPQVSHSVKVHDIADDLSVSITSAIARVLGPHGFSNPKVLAAAALVGLVALAIVLAMYRSNGLAFWSWPPARGQRAWPFGGLVALEWAGLVVVALAFSPDTNTRHLVLAVLVNAAAVALLVTPGSSARHTQALAGAILMFLGFIMPFGTRGSAAHIFYFRYGIPCWCLLGGYLLILSAALRYLRGDHRPAIGERRQTAANI